MKENKYYFISYSEIRDKKDQYFDNDAIKIHPLKWQETNRIKDHGPGAYFEKTLINYIEISEKEYNEFIEYLKEI